MGEIEVWGRLDGVNGWEEEVLERNQEIPEGAQQVVHLVDSRRGMNGEEVVEEDSDQTRALYEYVPVWVE